MLQKFKNISLLTKVLYILALLVLLLWVVPTALNYYSNVGKYQENTGEISVLSQKYAIDAEAQPFNANTFKEEVEKEFSSVMVTSINDKRHDIVIKMKREEIPNFHKFLETISLRYLVEIEGALEFTSTEEDEIEAKVSLVEL